MAIHIPKTLKVGGFEYGLDRGYGFRERTDIRGQADHDSLDIRIAESDAGGVTYDRAVIEELFVHEVLHCVNYVYNNSALDEETVARLSFGLHQVLVDNFTLEPKVRADGSESKTAGEPR